MIFFFFNFLNLLFIYKFIYFIYLFLAVLGLRRCTRALSSRSEWGHSSLQCAGLPSRRPPLPRSTGSRHVGFSSCGSQAPERRLSSRGARAQLLRDMWDPPGPGPKPVSPALAGRFSTTAPPGKPLKHLYVRFSEGFKAPQIFLKIIAI